jgi:4-amino-4-deoxy-L-arabinose transferase-like glycosyltransferase
MQRHARLIVAVLLAVVIAAGFLLRARGTTFGFPLTVHPDEPAVVERAVEMVATGDPNPHFFNYPTAPIYLQALVVAALQPAAVEASDLPAVDLYLWGRLLTALMAALTILAAAWLAYELTSARFRGPLAPLAAAALVASSSLHVAHSFLITVDVPMTLWVVLAAVMAVRIGRGDPGWRSYLAAAVFVGLAVGTRYTAVLAVVPVLFAHALRCGRPSTALASPKLWGFAAGAALVFLATTPYALLDLGTFWGDVQSEARHYATGHPGYESSGVSFGFYADTLLAGVGIVAMILALAGCVALLQRDRRALVAAVGFPVLYFVLVGAYPVRFDRHAVALVPFAAALGGVGLAAMVDALGNDETTALPRRLGRALAVALTVLVFASAVGQASRAWTHVHDVTLPDTRWLAKEWVEENLPAGSRVAREHYTPPLDRSRFAVTELGYFGLSEGIPLGHDYALASSDDFGRFFAHPERYPRRVAGYTRFFSTQELVKEFVPDGRTCTGPVIQVYTVEPLPENP